MSFSKDFRSFTIFISFACGVLLTNVLMKRSPLPYSIERIRNINKQEMKIVSDRCGIWQESYIKLHQSILNGHSKPRYLVSVAVEAGLGDRILGTITEFAFALLTNRAFQLITYGTLPRFEAAFSAPNINWSRSIDNDSLIDNLKYTYRNQRGYGGDRSYLSSINTDLYWPLYLINDDRGNEFFAKANVSTYPLGHENVQTIFAASNRGRIVRLFDNPYHRSQLFRMGLHPRTAFRCLFNFLFSPSYAILEAMSREFLALESPDTLKIAINIRVGDKTFDPEKDSKVQLETYERYFNCALSIEVFAKRPNQIVIWYVTSDSLRLRQLAKMKYGEKVLTEEKLRYYHGDCGASPEQRYGNCTSANSDASIIRAAGQIFAMAMCDYHIITKGSSFGKVVVGLSNEWHSTFQFVDKSRSCLQHDHDKFEDIATSGAGI